MAFFDSLLGKKKKEIKATCPITKEPIENGFGYLLTTAQIVSSQKYWDMIMTEPEMLSYTRQHFQNQANGTQMRTLVFEKYASISKPWMVSDSIISFFDVDKGQAREGAKKWWQTEGNFVPDNAGPATDKLDPERFSNAKDYAILEAGRKRAGA